MPKLREMLGNSGLQLSDSSIAHDDMSGQNETSENNDSQISSSHQEGVEQEVRENSGDEKILGSTTIPGGLNEIDFYV